MAAKFPTSPTLPTTGMEISSSMNLAQTSSGESGQEQLSALGPVRPPTIAEQRVALSTDSQYVRENSSDSSLEMRRHFYII